MSKDNTVKIVECPRAAWQGLSPQIPTETKVDYLRALVAAGFQHIDAVSFVSPRSVPQMADSEDVLKRLDPPQDVEICALVMSAKGVERAVNLEAVHTLVFPYSISESHLRKQYGQSAEENSEALEAVWQKADENGLNLVVQIAMAFGNPFGDPWSVDEIMAAVDNVADMGIKTVSLVESTAAASPATIAEVIEAVTREYNHMETGLHLYARGGEAGEKIAAAYNAGCRRFSSAAGGLGGAVPTELVLQTLAARGASVPISQPLTDVLRLSADIAARFVKH